MRAIRLGQLTSRAAIIGMARDEGADDDIAGDAFSLLQMPNYHARHG